MTTLLAYRHYGGGGGSDITHMIVNAIVHSLVWHVVGSLFRGHGILGGIMIAIVGIGIIYLLRRFRIV